MNALYSDDFNSSTLNESLWTKVNPLNDSTFNLIGTGTGNELLSITVPSGLSHNVWIDGNFAPRIMQATDNIDFNIEVKFQSQLSQKYQMQGVIVEQDNSNFLRFDFYSDGLNTHIFASNFTDGYPIVVVDSIISPSPSAVPIYMRVNRVGNQWALTYSTDGNNWIVGANFSKVMNVTSAGPFVGNVNDTVDPAPAFTGLIDYFFNTFSPSDTTPPTITLWYSDSQSFGQPGVPQQWVNILGNVYDFSGISSLNYSLNGGTAQDLSIGPDGMRLQSKGDFNIEIDHADLLCGNNSVVIKAVDAAGIMNSSTVSVIYSCNNVWPGTYSINWSNVARIQDAAQIVDGQWTKEPNSIRPTILGYDRIVNIGDMTWDDYEVTVPVTINTPIDSSIPYANIGFIMRWQGHYDSNGRQPRDVWYPLGALGIYTWDPTVNGFRLGIYGNALQPIAQNTNGKELVVGVPNIFKMRAQTIGTNTLYSLKVWEQGTDEPSNWTLSGYGVPGELKQGSVVLMSHYVDVSFGNVTIVSGPFIDDNESPGIIGNTPTGTNVPVNTEIIVSFNEMMNRTSTQSEFSTSPATTGNFSWTGNNMTYTPYSNLAYNTTYTSTVGTGAMDLAGNNLQSPNIWQFTTESNSRSVIKIDSVFSSANGTNSVNITALNVTDLSDFDITLSYDPSVVNVTNANNNPAFGTSLNNLEQASSGIVKLITLNNGSGQSGDVLLSTLTLKAVGVPSQVSYLNLTVNIYVNSAEADIPVGVQNGTFTVGLPKTGDINGNGKVTLVDAIYLAKHVGGFSGYEIIYADGDINANGKVTLVDAIYLAKHVGVFIGYEKLY